MAQRGLAAKYRRVLILLAVAVFFTSWSSYATLFVTPGFPTLDWAVLLAALAIPMLMMEPGSLRCLATPLVLWALVFIVLTALYFLIIPGGDVQILKNRTFSVILIVLFCAVFGRRPESILFARKLIFIAVLLGIALNVVDFLQLIRFVPLDSPIANPGRAAGLYMNANESGCALLLGMILSVGLVRTHWRTWFVACVFIGVVLTFSRAAILGWFIVVFLFWLLGYLRTGKILKIVFGLAFVLIFAWPFIRAYLTGHVQYTNALSRIGWFLAPSTHQSGFSEQQRLEVLEAGWQLFLQHPILGNGIGSTTTWSLSKSTHDMYLLFMDDYGILGLFLYVMLPLSLLIGARGEGRRIAMCVAVLLLFWGWFSHNELDNYYSLVAISLTSAIRTYLREPLSAVTAGRPPMVIARAWRGSA